MAWLRTPSACASLLALLLLAAGCAGQKVPSAGTAATGAGQGGYKIGKPYQITGVWYYPAVDYDYRESGIASWYGPGFHGKSTANGETYDMNDLTAAHRTLPLPSLVRVTNLDNGRQLALRVNDRGPFAHGRIIDVSRRAAQLLGFEQQGTARVQVQVMADESRQLAMQYGGGAMAALPAKGMADVAAVPSAAAAPTARVATETLAPPPGASASPTAAPLPPAPAPSIVNLPALASGPAPDGRVTVVPVKRTAMFVQAGAFTSVANANRLKAKLSGLGRAEIVPAVIGNQKYYRVRLGPIASLDQADQMLDRVVRVGHPEARIIVD